MVSASDGRLRASSSGQAYLDVILLGGKEDGPIADEVLRCYSGVQNLVGQTSLCEALGVIARAQVAMGPDTGLMHIAAAVSTPVVSLWGATSPARTGPYGFWRFGCSRPRRMRAVLPPALPYWPYLHEIDWRRRDRGQHSERVKTHTLEAVS